MASDHAAEQREAYYIPSKGTITQPLNRVVSLPPTLARSLAIRILLLAAVALFIIRSRLSGQKTAPAMAGLDENHYQKMESIQHCNISWKIWQCPLSAPHQSQSWYHLRDSMCKLRGGMK